LPSSPNHFRILADKLRVICIGTSLPLPELRAGSSRAAALQVQGVEERVLAAAVLAGVLPGLRVDVAVAARRA
jgi:hypothetical protein